MYPYAKCFVAVFGGLLLAVAPALAGSSMHTDSTEFDIDHTTTIGTTQLQPGDYVIQGTESQPQLDVLQNGKVVATVPCQWVRLNKKPGQSEILSSNNQVTQVEFQGRKEAAKIG
jgi:hypothetical protein